VRNPFPSSGPDGVYLDAVASGRPSRRFADKVIGEAGQRICGRGMHHHRARSLRVGNSGTPRDRAPPRFPCLACGALAALEVKQRHAARTERALVAVRAMTVSPIASAIIIGGRDRDRAPANVTMPTRIGVPLANVRPSACRTSACAPQRLQQSERRRRRVQQRRRVRSMVIGARLMTTFSRDLTRSKFKPT